MPCKNGTFFKTTSIERSIEINDGDKMTPGKCKEMYYRNIVLLRNQYIAMTHLKEGTGMASNYCH